MFRKKELLFIEQLQEQQATGKEEAVGLLHKAANLQTSFDSYEMMLFDID